MEMWLAWLFSVWLMWGTLGSAMIFRKANHRNGTCVYSFSVPSANEASCADHGEAVTALQQESKAQRLELESAIVRLNLLENSVKQLHGSQSRRSHSFPMVGLLQREVESLKREQAQKNAQVRKLESTISNLLQDKATLEDDKKWLEKETNELERRLENSVQQLALLRASHCPGAREAPGQDSLQGSQEGSKWNTENLGYQEARSELMEVSAAHLFQETPVPSQPDANVEEPDPAFCFCFQGNHCISPPVPFCLMGCGTLLWVGDPVTFRKAETIAGKYGVWMRDPQPVPPYTLNTTWRVDTVGTDIRQVFEYDHADQFMKGYPSKVHVLPQSMESTGAVVYTGALYFQKCKSRMLLKYDLKTESITVQKELSNAGYHGQFPYSWGGYTDIDLAVDEMGLWVIYSTENAKGAIVLSRLDPGNLEIEQTWQTNIRKQSVANSFMICGSLYTISSYSSPEATVNFIYRTNTGISAPLNIRFENRYRYISMVDYNPIEKKLLAWDNFNMVAYDIKLSKM